MREHLIAKTEMEKRLLQIENVLLAHDDGIKDLYDKLRPLLAPPPELPVKNIWLWLVGHERNPTLRKAEELISKWASSRTLSHDTEVLDVCEGMNVTMTAAQAFGDPAALFQYKEKIKAGGKTLFTVTLGTTVMATGKYWGVKPVVSVGKHMLKAVITFDTETGDSSLTASNPKNYTGVLTVKRKAGSGSR
jgi:hypothetical protein